MRESVLIYTSRMEQIELLNMEQRGVLLTAILNYWEGKELPAMDGITTMLYSIMKDDAENCNYGDVQ